MDNIIADHSDFVADGANHKRDEGIFQLRTRAVLQKNYSEPSKFLNISYHSNTYSTYSSNTLFRGWTSGWWNYAESIHAHFNSLKRIYRAIPNGVDRLLEKYLISPHSTSNCECKTTTWHPITYLYTMYALFIYV